MNEREHNELARARISIQEAADAKRQAERAKKRLALAGDELVATQADLEAIATTSTEPTVTTLANERRTSIDDTLNEIGRVADV